MNAVFVDTLFWVAFAVPTDRWHEAAIKAKETLGRVRMVTTDEVLIEYLNSLAKGEHIRAFAVKTVKAILKDPNIRVVPQSHESLLKGLALYADRSDKGYSLTDCISMNVMKGESLAQVLTHDHHFTQEGFEVLIVP